MGELIDGSVFRKWQAVINNSHVVERIRELRQLTTFTQTIAVSRADHSQNKAQLLEMMQMDDLTNYLLDINSAEPLESDSKLNSTDPLTDPEETA